MLKIEAAQKMLRDNPRLTPADLKRELNISTSYSHELHRAILSNGIPPHRGPIVRQCESVFSARPEIVAHALKHKSTSEIARIMAQKLGRPITYQYVTGLLKAKLKLQIKPSEKKRILELCK